jgi:hypothetical protein
MIQYKIEKLRTDFWKSQSPPHIPGTFSPEFIDEYRRIGQLKFQIYQQITQINLITCRRESYINQYRNLQERLSHDVFEKLLSVEQTKDIKKETTNLYQLIMIDTEIYFIYSKLLLDRLVSLVKHYLSLFLKMEENFTQLWEEINKNGCNDKQLEDYIKNKTKWYPLMIRVPRNVIFIHDFETTGSGGGDHMIDFGITKSTEKSDSQKPRDKLRIMKKSHLSDLPELVHQDNPFQIIRIFDHNSEKLSLDEIKKLVQIHEQIGGMFPYVIEVNKKLQDLLDFFAQWTKQKILSSQLGSHIP